MFVVVELAVLVVGLVIALIRTSRAPALFPLRLLAAVYVDVFRGVPMILLVYLVGFGIPALQLTGLPTDPVVLGGIALRSPTAPTSPRSTGPASTRSTAASATRRWRSA